MKTMQKKVVSLVLVMVMSLMVGSVAMAAENTTIDQRQVVQNGSQMEILGEVEVQVDENGIVTYSSTEIGQPVFGNLSGYTSSTFGFNFDRSYKNVYAIFTARTTDGSSLNATYRLNFNGVNNSVTANGGAYRYYVGNVGSGQKYGTITYVSGDKKGGIFAIQFVGEK